MPLPSRVEPSTAATASSSLPIRRRGPGYLFGVPMGDLGLFATVLMSLSSGFAAFFAATFVGIISLLVYNTALHHTADYSISYRLVGLPVGLFVLGVVSIYLGSLWVRRMLRRE